MHSQTNSLLDPIGGSTRHTSKVASPLNHDTCSSKGKKQLQQLKVIEEKVLQKPNEEIIKGCSIQAFIIDSWATLHNVVGSGKHAIDTSVSHQLRHDKGELSYPNPLMKTNLTQGPRMKQRTWGIPLSIMTRCPTLVMLHEYMGEYL